MATGYTAIIGEKPDVTLREYALRCSRAVGALIEMRDSSLDAKIPEEFHPSDYHKHELENAQKTLKRAESMTLEQAAREADREYQSSMKNYEESQTKNHDLRARYESMLGQVANWEAPTPDHQGLKDFMTSQLEESIKFDCYEVEAPQKQTPKQYKAELIKSAKWNVAHHGKEWKEEVNSARERTEWVQALLKALPKE